MAPTDIISLSSIWLVFSLCCKRFYSSLLFYRMLYPERRHFLLTEYQVRFFRHFTKCPPFSLGVGAFPLAAKRTPSFCSFPYSIFGISQHLPGSISLPVCRWIRDSHKLLRPQCCNRSFSSKWSCASIVWWIGLRIATAVSMHPSVVGGWIRAHRRLSMWMGRLLQGLSLDAPSDGWPGSWPMGSLICTLNS